MRKSTSLLRLFSAVAITGMMVFTDAMAEKIIWVNGNYDTDADGVQNDQPFIDVLVENGYEVQVEIDSMAGIPLSAEQIAVLESGDLIIVSRATSSGNYADPAGWNAITKPLILNSAYLSRLSKWGWVATEDLVGAGDSGCPLFYAEIPEHPIFAGVTLDADGTIAALDGSVGTGNTSLTDYMDCGEGELIASVDPTGTMAIVYWPTDVAFTLDALTFAGGPRMLFECQSREGAAFGVGMYNLTPEGEKMYLNAVAFMLGKDTGVSVKAGSVPADFTLEQNFPNPFNPMTNIEFTLSKSGHTTLQVFNIQGKLVASLVDNHLEAGTHTVHFSADNLSAGIYYYSIRHDGFTDVKKMILIK